jgi:hypothetical protein
MLGCVKKSRKRHAVWKMIEGSRNPDTGGVGLGLSVTRSIIWEHGGDITLATRKGGGLSVRLGLPAGPGPSSPVQEQCLSQQYKKAPILRYWLRKSNRHRHH